MHVFVRIHKETRARHLLIDTLCAVYTCFPSPETLAPPVIKSLITYSWRVYNEHCIHYAFQTHHTHHLYIVSWVQAVGRAVRITRKGHSDSIRKVRRLYFNYHIAPVTGLYRLPLLPLVGQRILARPLQLRLRMCIFVNARVCVWDTTRAI